MSEPIRLFHGTTASAATAIAQHGWQPFDVSGLVSSVAGAHGFTSEQVWDVLHQGAQTYLHEEGRGQGVSFALRLDKAGLAWAQRAPEARREALWAVWRLQNPERSDTWTQHVDGHLWVLRHLADDQPAVVEVAVTYDELVEWEAMSGGFNLSPLPEEDLVRSGLLPEIAIEAPLWFPADDVTVHLFDRHVEWDVYALLLGLERDEFIAQAEAGALGDKGTGDENMPVIGGRVPWWPLTTVLKTLDERGLTSRWEAVCSCPAPSS